MNVLQQKQTYLHAQFFNPFMLQPPSARKKTTYLTDLPDI